MKIYSSRQYNIFHINTRFFIKYIQIYIFQKILKKKKNQYLILNIIANYSFFL